VREGGAPPFLPRQANEFRAGVPRTCIRRAPALEHSFAEQAAAESMCASAGRVAGAGGAVQVVEPAPSSVDIAVRGEEGAGRGEGEEEEGGVLERRGLGEGKAMRKKEGFWRGGGWERGRR
jgi:hypothetical protein